MSDLIPLAELLAEIDREIKRVPACAATLQRARSIALTIPTVAAAPAVRCGECANRNTCDCPLAYAVESGIGNDLPGDDDFCSYGERMDADAPERGKERE